MEELGELVLIVILFGLLGFFHRFDCTKIFEINS